MVCARVCVCAWGGVLCEVIESTPGSDGNAMLRLPLSLPKAGPIQEDKRQIR